MAAFLGGLDYLFSNGGFKIIDKFVHKKVLKNSPDGLFVIKL
jgi:hypothetical protein